MPACCALSICRPATTASAQPARVGYRCISIAASSRSSSFHSGVRQSEVPMQALIAVVLFLAVPEKGTICFGNECTATAGLVFDVKPAEVERRFVWTSGDGSRVVLGKLAAKAASVDVAADARTVSLLSLRGDPQRGWPLETRFAIVETKD